jgi:N-acylmannosamine kinase
MLVLDVGGTKVAVARWVGGRLQDRRQWPMPPTPEAWSQTLALMATTYPGVSRVAAAVTGLTDGQVWSAVNQQLISFGDGYALADALTQVWQCPSILLNDAQAAAWGEFVASDRQPGNLLFITLSTGVGGGLVLDGQLRSGVRGLAGHIGHVGSGLAPLDGDTRCGCGRLNCLEALASGTALARQASHLSAGRWTRNRYLPAGTRATRCAVGCWSERPWRWRKRWAMRTPCSILTRCGWGAALAWRLA